MSHVRFTLTYVLFWIILVLTGFLVENVALLTSSPREGFEMNAVYLLSFLLLLVIIVYFVTEHKKNNLKINWLLAILLLTLFIINIVTMWSQSESTTYSYATDDGTINTYTVVVTNSDKILFTLQLLFTFVVIYIFLVPYRQKQLTQKTNVWLYWLYVLVALISIGCSIWLDWDVFQGIFTNEQVWTVGTISSFYTNSNFYGMSLMLAIMCLCVIQLHKPRWYSFPLMLVFFVACVSSSCEAAVFISIVIIFGYVIYSLFNGFRKHWGRTLTYLIVWSLILIGLVITYYVLVQKEVGFVVKIDNYLTYHILTAGNNFSLTESRGETWGYALTVLGDDITSWIFGKGYGVDSMLVHGVYMSHHPNGDAYSILTAHSTFLQLLVKGGIIGAVFYYGLMLYFLFCIIYLCVKKKWKNAYIYLLCFLGIMIHGVVESTFFFEGNTKGLVITLLFFMPAVNEATALMKKGKKEIEYVKSSPNFSVKIDSHLFTQSISAILMMVFMAALTLLLSQYTYMYEGGLTALLYILVAELILILFVPYLVTLWYKNSIPRRFKVRVFLMGGLIVALNVIADIFLFTNEAYFAIPLVLLLSLLIPFVIYFFACNGSFKDCIVDTFKGCFVMTFVPNIYILLGGTLVSLFLSTILSMSLLTQLLIVVANMIIYFIIGICGRNKSKKEVIYKLNSNRIAVLRREVSK